MAGIVGRAFNPRPKPATRDERDRAVLAALVKLYEKQPVGPSDIGKALNWPGLYFDGSSRLQDNLKRLVRAGLVAKVPVGHAHRGNRYMPTGAGVTTDICRRFMEKAAADEADRIDAATMPGPCGYFGGERGVGGDHRAGLP